MATSKTVLITGANRGIGLALAKSFHQEGWNVLGTARQPAEAKELKSLASQVFELDVANVKSIEQLASQLKSQPIDVLINNAGVLYRDDNPTTILEQFTVNSMGPLLLSQALVPSLKLTPHPKVVTITSRMGSIADNTSGGYYGYRASKSAVNAFMKSFSLDHKNIHSILLHPGYIQTRMVGFQGDMDTDQCVAEIWKNIFVDTIRLDEPQKFPSGSFVHRDGSILPW